MTMRKNKSRLGLYVGLASLIISCTGFTPAANADESKPATLKIDVIGETSTDKESSEVLAALHKLLTSVEHRDYDAIDKCLSPDVVMIEEGKKEPHFGKQAVLDKIKSNINGSKEKSPVKHMVLTHPFVAVKGDTAMVSFQAKKELADGSKFESLCSEVYERKDGNWLILKFRSNWKPAK